MNFLLVIPRFVEYGKEYAFPLGMLYISSSLKRHGVNVTCLNLCSHQLPVETVLQDYILRHKIQVVCTGGMAIHWRQIEAVLVATKRFAADLITVVGGAIISSNPELAMRHLPIDIGVIGEGEHTIIDLADCFANGGLLSDVPGIIYRNPADDSVNSTVERPPISNLDELPLPDYDAFEYGEYIRLKSKRRPFYENRLFDIGQEQIYGEILASRSCPFDCTFCYHPLGKKYRQRNIQHVLAEMALLIDRFNINFFNVLDELFACNNERIREFVEGIKQFNIQWTAQWRVDNLSVEMLEILKSSGMFLIGLGLESASDRVLKSMRKKTTRQEIDNAFSLAFKHGIRPGGNLIFGDVAENEETIAESLDWWFAHPEYQVGMQCIMILPDSFLYRYAVENRRITDELGHLTGENWRINVTDMDEACFNEHHSKITYWDHTMANLSPGTILQMTIDASTGKPIYLTNFACPYCSRTSSYHYYCPEGKPDLFTVILCKHCNIRFKQETILCFPADFSNVLDYYDKIKQVFAVS